ncbi:ATP-binding protein [Pseudoduganella sp. LjRoot289]|uniref:ATP-binding protein n=1 Tax=Pseudoduganella sp. LjRoot289 TaxID=3342314 RepID=UPI003ED15D40
MTQIPPIKLQSILLVTGAPFELAPLEAALSASGFSLLAVSRADSALNAVRAGGVALVLLDGAQAGSSSFELCRHLISASPTPDLPIVMLTPWEEPDEQQRALSAGARACLRLPFSTGAVLEQVLALLPAPDAPADVSAGIEQLRQLRLADAASHQHAEALREGQNQLLEMVARGAPLKTTLDKLMLLIEAQSPGVLCSTLLLGQDGRTIRVGAGPSLPPAYLAAIDGLSIGAVTGSCGTAMYRKEAVIVADIMKDALWAPYAGIADQFGLRACWSVPILMDADTVLGSFAMYYREVRSPTTGDLRLIGVATHLAGIAIARTRHEEELKRHRKHLEELVAERTSELRRAKERVEMANDELATALENLSMTQDELVRRDKLAALGALVAGIAHELNTPIGNSLMAAGTMAERTQALRAAIAGGARRSELDAYLDEAAQADDIVVRNLTRAASLLHSFKAIAIDTDRSQRRRFVLDALVAELIPPLHAMVKRVRVSVAQDVAPDLVMDSYPAPLSQVLQALFDNSVVHGFEGRDSGQIRIGARMTDQGEIAISFADDGKGISAEDQEHVYDPFFTTRRGAGGSGLGLHVAHNIVAGVLGGRIKLASTPGLGATFTLLLPPVAPL